jgi:hypothetical protein
MKQKRTRKNPHGGGAWQIRLAGAQRGQATGQTRERSQGRVRQKSQEDPSRAAQRPATPARASQEVENAVIALIRARFGDVAIGLGELGSCPGCARVGEGPWN